MGPAFEKDQKILHDPGREGPYNDAVYAKQYDK